tara:strand:+ start:22 stop:900 length:879 start_codon:yes stop_codon:yes gene_type:complete
MAYNIDQFSKITGINKLLLRTWENRYNFLTPKRTETKIRIYSDELLILALNTKLLLDNGYKISKISKKNNVEIENLITEISTQKTAIESKVSIYINQFIKSGLKFDTSLFNKTFSDCSSKFSMIDLYKKIMLPTFSKIGLFWLSNKMNPAQEHFLSEMFKQKIYNQIDNIKNKGKKERWLLFLPPNEYHELGLLFTRFLLTYYGFDVIYLGANVPYSSLDQISKTQLIPNILFFSVSNFSKKNIDITCNNLKNYFPKSNIYLVSNIDDKKNGNLRKINLINDPDSFIKRISK